MNFAYPSQRFQDWISQQWCIWRGKKIDPDQTDWLMGPFGNTDSIADDFFSKLALDENLEIKRNVKDGGILSSINDLELSDPEYKRLSPNISSFYENTSLYDLDLSIKWNPFYRIFGGLINYLYSNRLKQLNLPLDQSEVSAGINSEVITLSEPKTGNIKYTIWYRTLKSNGRVLYSGIYTTCRIPSGKVCIKVIFPLPRGNATIIMSPTVGPNGELFLMSSGKKYGDPGFYFLLNDSKGGHWAQYVHSFRENLNVFVDESGTLRAKHSITLWKQRVLDIYYKMFKSE
ncbi:MAG: hypothetical protein COA79_12570 [Planctomycetota bacterium]|nr:MAG: hypothetical protein COA79_12570 [Planctomycetota bacterium]